jgi:hypothetical protein
MPSTLNFDLGVENPNFLWKNEKMAEFYEGKAKPRSERSSTT